MPFEYAPVCTGSESLLILLNTHLRGIYIGPRKHNYTSVAYAEDVTVILTDMAEVEILERTIRNYERATGEPINWEKSHALPVGAWDVSRRILTIPYTTEVKILGMGLAPRWRILFTACGRL
jgi:hypothetical protein